MIEEKKKPTLAEVLARIEDLVRYQAVAQICTLTTTQCGEILELVSDVRKSAAQPSYDNLPAITGLRYCAHGWPINHAQIDQIHSLHCSACVKVHR